MEYVVVGEQIGLNPVFRDWITLWLQYIAISWIPIFHF